MKSSRPAPPLGFPAMSFFARRTTRRSAKRTAPSGSRDRTVITRDTIWQARRTLLKNRPDQGVVAVHDTLDRLAAVEPRAANLVSLCSFGGRTLREAAADL
jgi:hypothetical protein